MTGRGRERGGRAVLSGRLRVCLGIFTALFLLVLYRAFDLQFLDTEKAFRHAKRQQIGYLILKSKRGGIYDSGGALIASSRLVHSFYLNPREIQVPEAFARAVAELSGLDYQFVLSRASDADRSFVWIKRQAPDSVAQKLVGADIKGLRFVMEQKRLYPQGNLMAPVVGFTDIDSRGVEGLEYSLNRYLTGRDVRIRVSRDGEGGSMLFRVPHGSVRTHGADVFLTVDSNIQYAVEDELRKGVERFGAESASAVFMEPSTGRILAMASYPSFDPNNFSSYTQKELRNLPVWFAFEPGSILKPFLVSAALEEGVVNPETVFDCERGRRRIGETETEIRDSSPHGRLTVTDTLVYSSNICSSKIAELLGASVYNRYLREFGFGSKSGTLIPGEHRGVISSPARWGRVGLATISFGQGMSVNALQMAVAVSAIANGGHMMAPHIVDRIVDAEGHMVFSRTPSVVGRVVSYEVARTVADMMRQTVERGTGKRAAVGRYGVAGKTGTAQIADPEGTGYLRDGSYISSFLGFAPYDNPRMALVIVVNRPRIKKYGSQVAAPIFAAIARRTLGMLEMGAPSAEGALKQFPMPDLRGKSVRDVARWAAGAGMELRVTGNGFANDQSPPPGEMVKTGEMCEVSFSGNLI